MKYARQRRFASRYPVWTKICGMCIPFFFFYKMLPILYEVLIYFSFFLGEPYGLENMILRCISFVGVVYLKTTKILLWSFAQMTCQKQADTLIYLFMWSKNIIQTYAVAVTFLVESRSPGNIPVPGEYFKQVAYKFLHRRLLISFFTRFCGVILALDVDIFIQKYLCCPS